MTPASPLVLGPSARSVAPHQPASTVRRLGLLLLLVAATVVAALAPSAARADDGWQPTVDLASPVDGAANLPSLAVDRDGTSYAAWVRASSSGGPSLVQVARRPYHGAWEAATTVSRGVTGETGSRVTAVPRLAVRDGVVAVTWLQTAPDSTRAASNETWAAVRSATGTWDAPRSLSTVGPSAAPVQASDTTVAVGPGGAVTVAWLDDDATAVVSRDVRPGGAWSARRTVSPGADGLSTGYLELAVGDDGAQTLAWTDDATADGVPGVLAARRSAADAAWGAPVALSGPGRYSLFPKLAVAPDGHVEVVWASRVQEVSAFAQYEVQASHAAAGSSSWSAPEVLSPPGGEANGRGTSKSPVVTFDAAGNETVAWVRSQGANADLIPDRVQVRTRPAGGSWDAVQDVWSGLRNPTLRKVSLAAGAAGQAAVAVSGYTSAVGSAAGPRSVRVLRRETVDGAWSAEREVSAPGVGSSTVMSWEPAIAAGPRGDVDVAWHAPDRTGEVGVQATSFRVAAPVDPVTPVQEPTGPSDPTPVAPTDSPSAAVPAGTPVAPVPSAAGTPGPTAVALRRAAGWRTVQDRRFAARHGVRVAFVGVPGRSATVVVRRGGRIVGRASGVRIGTDGRLTRRVRFTAAGRTALLAAQGTASLRITVTAGGRSATAGVRLG